MPSFTWEARTKQGENSPSGTMVADTIEAVQARLRQQALQPQVVKKKPLSSSCPTSAAAAKSLLEIWCCSPAKFSTMIDAGLPLVQCLDILAGQNDNPGIQEGSL